MIYLRLPLFHHQVGETIMSVFEITFAAPALGQRVRSLIPQAVAVAGLAGLAAVALQNPPSPPEAEFGLDWHGNSASVSTAR